MIMKMTYSICSTDSIMSAFKKNMNIYHKKFYVNDKYQIYVRKYKLIF